MGCDEFYSGREARSFEVTFREHFSISGAAATAVGPPPQVFRPPPPRSRVGKTTCSREELKTRKATDIYFPFTTLNSDTTYQLLSDLPRRFVEVHHLIKIPRRNLKLKCAF